MRRHLVALGAMTLLACDDAPPDVVVCTTARASADTVTDCACGLEGTTPALITAVLAAPGSFHAGENVRVRLAGADVATGVAAADGSLAVAVLLPGGTALPVDLTLAFGRAQTLVVRVPTTAAAVVTGDRTFVETEREVLHYAATTRATEWTDCDDDVPLTPAPSRLFAANLVTGQASVAPAPALEQPWDVAIPGRENDVAIVVVQHEGGGVSGCFASRDVCCDCPGGGDGVRLRRAHCSDALRAAGDCVTRGVPPDAGSDAGPDAFVSFDAGPPDDAPLPDGGPS